MAEYQYFDGESFITFNIVYATEKEVQLAITNRGHITVATYDLYTDNNGNEYFEYGCDYNKIYIEDYSDWEEIVDELKKEGFELDGIDEELFIQDVEGIDDGSVNWDYVNPEELFNTLNASGVLDDDEKYEIFVLFAKCVVSMISLRE